MNKFILKALIAPKVSKSFESNFMIFKRDQLTQKL